MLSIDCKFDTLSIGGMLGRCLLFSCLAPDRCHSEAARLSRVGVVLPWLALSEGLLSGTLPGWNVMGFEIPSIHAF